MNKQQQYKPSVVGVRRAHVSSEDEAPRMATTETTFPVIILRPSWLDLPASRLFRRITLIGVCSIPAVAIITLTVSVIWRGIG